MQPTILCIFVSSTWLDLQPERKSVEAALQRLRETKFVGMEYFGSRDENTRCASLDEVDRSQVYIGIFGGRYGSGITEAEYRRGRERGLPCLIYFKDEANIPAEWHEADPEKAARLAALKKELREYHTVTTFTTPDDLSVKMTADLHRWLFDDYLAPRLEKAAQGECPPEEAQALLAAIKDLSALNQDLLARLREAGYVIAQGERSVAVGRNVIHSILNTGDHNQFFIGDYERLRDAYIEPWSVFERVRLEHFTGRDWLTTAVDAFLRDNDRGYFVVEAGAGLGKTTFLAHLVRKQGYIHHFVELAPGKDGIAPGLKNLAAQLVLTYHISAYEIEGSLPGAAVRPDYLLKLLRQAAEQRHCGEKIVLVVDALDEAGTPLHQNVLGLPRALPEGVFIIVSQRPVSVTLQVETPTTPRYIFRLTANSDENKADIRRFLERAATWSGITYALGSKYTPEQFITTLLEKSNGVWVYLHYVIHEIEKSERSPLDLANLPDGLTQYYARYWARWRDKDEGKWYTTYLPLLTTLAVVQEAITAGCLADLADVEMRVEELRRLLNEQWIPFLVIEGQGQQARYRLYHATLQEFFNGQVEREKLLTGEETLVDELTAATHQAHHRLAEHYLTAWGGLEGGLPRLQEAAQREIDEGYGLRHLPAHMEASGRVDDLHRLLALETGEQRNAWYEGKDAIGDVAGYLTDVTLAWRLAEKAYGEHAGESIGLQTRYALMKASLNSLAENMPTELLAAIASRRLRPPKQVLAYAQSLPQGILSQAWKKIEALKALADVLQEPLRSESLRAGLMVAREAGKTEDRAKLLALLAPSLPETLLDEALRLAQEIEDKNLMELAIAGLAPRFAELGKAEEGLALLRRIGNGELRDEVLFGMGEALFRMWPYLSLSALREALEIAQSMSTPARNRAVSGLVPRLAQLGKHDEALRVAQNINEAAYLADALAWMAPYIDCETLERAIGLAWTLGDFTRKMNALGCLSQRLPEPRKTELLQKAFEEAKQRYDSRGDYGRGKLVPYLPEALLREFLRFERNSEVQQLKSVRLAELGFVDDAIAELRTIEFKSSQMDALQGIVPYLTKAHMAKAMSIVAEFENQRNREVALSRLLPRLAQLGSPQEALTQALWIKDERLRSEAIAGIAPYLDIEGLRKAVQVQQMINDVHAQREAVVQLAAYAPEALLPEALAAIKAGINAETQELALARLGKRGHTVCQQTLNGLKALENETSRAKALLMLAPFLEAPYREEAVRKALDTEWYIGDRWWAVQALTRLISALGEPLKTDVCIFARDMVRKLVWELVGRETVETLPEILLGFDSYILGKMVSLLIHLGKLYPVLAAALNIRETNPRSFVVALACLEPHLPEPVREEVLTKVLATVRQFSNSYSVVTALGEVATELSEPLLREALSVATEKCEPQHIVGALARLTPRLAELGYPDEALSLVRRSASRGGTTST